MNLDRRLLLVFIFTCFHLVVSAQSDTLVFHKGNQLIGEIKALDRGVLTVETDFSDSDFKIKWTDVKEVYSSTRFLVSLRYGARINGRLSSIQSDSVSIISDSGGSIEVGLTEIVYLNGLKPKFWDRVTASIDLGVSVSKANNLKQFTTHASIGYLADKWSANFYYDDLSSSQDSIADTRRKDGGLNYRYFLPRDYYATPEITYLSNTEQALAGRLTVKLGGGKFFVHTNKSYWGLSAGLSLLKESYTNDTDSRSSAELYVGTELNIFDMGDLDFLTNIYVYPSLTESKRMRSDFKFDLKYDFLNDFYIKLSLSLNYDNQPAVSGKETDYVYGISFGWEL